MLAPLWSPYYTLADLLQIILQDQEGGGQKDPVVN